MLNLGGVPVDHDCRCECCPDPGSGGLGGGGSPEMIHTWDAESLPHPYTLTAETLGGAVINSYELSLVRRNVRDTFFYAGRMTLDVTAPSGRWNAWIILWMPDSSVPITEVVDVNDPDGIVSLLDVRSSAIVRLGRITGSVSDGPYPVWGLVVEYDGVRYYTPHAYIPNRVPDPWDPQTLIDNRPYCWKAISNENDGETINPSTLDYSGSPVVWPCNPDPAAITRVGHVIGLTTVGETPDDDREAAGNIVAAIDFDNPQAAAYYRVSCDCWWVPAIPTLTATFETAPVEIVGSSITLTRQGNGTFAASGTFGVDSDPFNLTYTPCTSMVLEFPDCGLTMTFLHQPFSGQNFNGYVTTTDQWQPIDVRYTNRVCYDGDVNPVPDCGLTPNTTLPVGSPPFQELWDCFLFTIRLEEP